MSRTFEGSFEAGRVHATLSRDRIEVRIGDATRSLEARRGSPGEVVLLLEDGRVVRAHVATADDGVWVSIGGRIVKLARAQKARAGRGGHAHDAALEAPMPGTCRDVFVKPGDKVEKGARLLLLEAMKMEHELRAPRAGTVKAVNARKGEQVGPGVPLIELE